MQTSELEKKKNNLLGDEECIHFRPSPNFKHMKKYLKSKFEESNSSPYQSSDPSTTPPSEDQETVTQQATSSSMAQRVQPPLPPNSPPPDVLIVPKQEVEDDEYNDRTATQSQVNTKKEEVADKQPEKTMCRQFARGMCTRGASCIYAHELILSQLPGVYTFCKNFQNTVCNFPKCKFVHATVFEKEHYYRTGYLPPHSLVHLKESNSALGPPTVLEGTPAETSQVFSNPPPAIHPGVSSLPTSGCAPPPVVQPNPEVFGANLLAARKQAMPAKRDWSELELALATHENESNQPKQKKCKHCDINELRLQCSKTKFEKAMETSQVYAKQKLQLMKWDARLNNVFDMLIKSKSSIPSASPIVNTNNIALRDEKKNIETRNQFDLFLQLFNRMNELDNSQKLIFSEIMNIVKEKKT